MVKVAAIVDDMFEDSEYLEPVEAFEEKGHFVTNIGIKKGNIVKGKKGSQIEIEKAIKDVKVNDFEALLIPGGSSPTTLRTNEEAVKLVKEFMEKKKAVFAICHGPQLLISADVLNNRNLTGYKSIKDDIIQAGGNYFDKEVVVDENLVTSRTPDDLTYFISEALKLLSLEK
ncbi:MAG: type 1 glutamine amidotransferase [Parachlamydiales bacterium]|nr:type 1 glutamine amidotransferase [Parachlamydiales bacterium]